MVAWRQFPDPFAQPFPGPLRELQLHMLLLHVSSDRKAQDMPPSRSRYRTLLAVHHQFHATFEKADHAVKHALPRSFALHVDAYIICVAYETMASSLQLMVEVPLAKWTGELCRLPSHRGSDFELDRAAIFDGRMHPFGVEEAVDVFTHDALRVRQIDEVA